MPDVEKPRQHLEDVPVESVMTHGLVSCTADMSLGDVAARMDEQRIHCVLVMPADDPPEARSWGVISDLDLIGAANMDEITAGAIAATPTVTVSTRDSVDRAARLMTEYQTAHLLVLDPSGTPSGVISTLDIARVMHSGG